MLTLEQRIAKARGGEDGSRGRGPGGRGVRGAIRKKPPPHKRVVVIGKTAGGAAKGRAADASLRECLIGSETDIKSAAGFICVCLRDGEPPVVKAISASNVNRALKTIALVHDYLESANSDLFMLVDFPEFASTSFTGNVQLHVFKKSRRTDLARVNEQVFVSAESEPPKVQLLCGLSIVSLPCSHVLQPCQNRKRDCNSSSV